MMKPSSKSLIFLNNQNVSDSDDFSPDNFYVYVTMQIAIDRGGEEPQLAKFVKQMKNNTRNPIGIANKTPILDTRVYEIELQYGFRQTVAAIFISEKLFAKVY